MCSFGDASTNHAVATAAFNTAVYCAYQRLPMPLLFICEDNGLGISVRTPTGWIETSFGSRPHLRYVSGGRRRSCSLWPTSPPSWRIGCASKRKPAFLHLRTVRYGGHAGTDVEAAYRSGAEMRAEADRDPILGTARALLATGWTQSDLLQRHDEIADMVYKVAGDLANAEQLTTAEEVIRPLSHAAPRGGQAAWPRR